MPEQLTCVKAKSRGRCPVPCDSCRKPMTWFRTHPNNKPIPFDGDPVALKTGRDADTGEPLEYLSAAECHFVTCPNAAEHRRPRR